MNLVLRALNSKYLLNFRQCRLKGSKSHDTTKKSKRYADSLNLPQTGFPLTMKNGAAAQREAEVQKTKAFKTLYAWQREQDWDRSFVLHDGPPYANGKPHVGHVVNKVLKDITNRFKVLHKHRVHYVPGWDCHGMPIEMKALVGQDGQLEALSPLEIRARAKLFAEASLQEQKAAFQSWGIMGDWESPYQTLTPAYEAKQLEVFYKIFEKGFMYRDYMPVYWSPSSQTALAEAELEYNPSHVSKAVFVRFTLKSPQHPIFDLVDASCPLHAVIWTTTPWTLPFNRAICFNPDLRYSILKDSQEHCYYLCEEAFIEKMSSKLNKEVYEVWSFEGSMLENLEYENPLHGQTCPFLPGDHVASGKGTGLVHTAPAHGHEDFALALKHNLSKECHVDGQGRFCSGVVDSLLGKTVGVDAELAVIDLLGKCVLQVEDYTHSYPYDWRTKEPLLIRASQQWFINTAALQDKALESLSQVKICPPQSENAMVGELISRSYWCISRQRAWGVPIPVFYNKLNGEPLLTGETVQHVSRLVKELGSDCWWRLPVSQLLPDDLLTKIGTGKSSDYEKGDDILDIWFDSGVSWASVLSDCGGQADVYLEGIDQYKGWFQTSLLTSVALRGHAPYRSIITHGFATDETGKKMSKSLGNVVDPQDVIYGGKNKRAFPSYGVDVLRWWVAHSHQHTQIMIGPSILQQLNQDVFKIRKCLRHLVGCLHDFSPEQHLVEYDRLTAVDKYILHLLYTVTQQITETYNSASYNKVVQSIEKFVYGDLSSFYISNTRDRNYCDHSNSESRRSSQTTMYHVIKSLTSSFAPIMPHLAQEFHHHIPRTAKKTSDTDCVFRNGWYGTQTEWNNTRLESQLRPVFDMRHDLMEEIGMENPVEFDMAVYCSPRLRRVLLDLQPELTSSSSPLCEIFQTSLVTVLEDHPSIIPEDVVIVEGSSQLTDSDLPDVSNQQVDYKMLVSSASFNICERCRKYTSESSSAPCSRCLGVLAHDWAS